MYIPLLCVLVTDIEKCGGILTSKARNLDIVNYLVAPHLLEKGFGDLQRHLKVVTLKQPVHQVHHIHALGGSVK